LLFGFENAFAFVLYSKTFPPFTMYIPFCTMEDLKKGTLCLDHFTLELEEERKFIIVKKPKNSTKKLNLK
jgi:hypothetical protein